MQHLTPPQSGVLKYYMSTDQSESNKSSANSVSNLATEAKKLTAHGFAIIPLNDRIPIIKYKHRRKDLATTREIDNWFSDGDGRVAKANGIAIAINTTEFGLDTDGEQCEFIFLDKIVPNLSPSLQEKILNTMHTQTPHGHHRTFRYAASDFPNGIKEKTYFRLNGEHSEIALKGKDHYLFERGPGYKTINDVEHVATLTKAEVEEFIGALEKFSNKEEALTKVVNKLQEYFVKPHRNDIIFSVSGYLHKSKTPLETTIEIAKRLIDATGYDDENPDKIYRTIRDTYSKDRDSDQVSGHRRLREVLKQASPKNDGRIDDVLEIISLIEQTLKKVGLFEISWKEHKQAGEELLRENFDAGGEYDNESSRDSIELAGINTDILVQLASDVISLISISPPVLYIADSREKHIIKAVVRNESGNTEESKNAKGQNQTIITKQQKLYRKDKIILAVPRGKVVIIIVC
jgi:hypothetical protein